MKSTRLAQSVLVGCVLIALSCREPSPTGIDATTAPPSGDLLGTSLMSRIGLLSCTPLPADSASQTIGAEGGVLQVGPHTLSIPAGALDTAVTLTAVAPSATVNSVQFGPQGLTFQQPATLTMSYANCRGLALGWSKRIAYTTDVLEILEYLSSVDDKGDQAVSAPIDHFSTYAVAW